MVTLSQNSLRVTISQNNDKISKIIVDNQSRRNIIILKFEFHISIMEELN